MSQGEAAWISALLAGFGSTVAGSGVVVGIGDDAAVLEPPPGERLVATVDMVVEGQHFTRSGPGASTPEDIGWHALAVNLSDMAAMGARPLWALCSLGVPDGCTPEFARRLAGGMAELAAPLGVRVVGGNLARVSQGLVVDVTALGSVGQAIRRDGAVPGDLVCVTGHLGRAAAGLALARSGGRPDAATGSLWAALRRPLPRVRAGIALGGAAGQVHAACDISDGLALDLGRVCAASRVGAALWRPALPMDAATRAAAAGLGQDALAWAVHGGEDYELLLAVPPAAEHTLRRLLAAVETPLVVVGAFLEQPGLYMGEGPGSDLRPLPNDGWDPFA